MNCLPQLNLVIVPLNATSMTNVLAREETSLGRHANMHHAFGASHSSLKRHVSGKHMGSGGHIDGKKTFVLMIIMLRGSRRCKEEKNAENCKPIHHFSNALLYVLFFVLNGTVYFRRLFLSAHNKALWHHNQMFLSSTV